MGALLELRRRAPSAGNLILTMHDDPRYLRQALESGAAGFVLKKAADVELHSAVRAVLRGEVFGYPSMTRVLLDDLLITPQAPAEIGLWNLLSEREQEVLRRVAIGYTSAEIAEWLSLSVKTVETYWGAGWNNQAFEIEPHWFSSPFRGES
jgi:two-component system response regulator NreC